jgi:hypothetical protein
MRTIARQRFILAWSSRKKLGICGLWRFLSALQAKVFIPAQKISHLGRNSREGERKLLLAKNKSIEKETNAGSAINYFS